MDAAYQLGAMEAASLPTQWHPQNQILFFQPTDDGYAADLALTYRARSVERVVTVNFVFVQSSTLFEQTPRSVGERERDTRRA